VSRQMRDGLELRRLFDWDTYWRKVIQSFCFRSTVYLAVRSPLMFIMLKIVITASQEHFICTQASNSRTEKKRYDPFGGNSML
jgi:hypothetical protein